MSEYAELMNEIIDVVTQTTNNVDRVVRALDKQSSLLAAVPTKNLLGRVSAAIGALILLAVGTSTWLLVDGQREIKATGDLNKSVITTYCAAAPDLPECSLAGSPTTKATMILTNCRVYATLTAATPPEKRLSLVTNAGCRGLGF